MQFLSYVNAYKYLYFMPQYSQNLYGGLGMADGSDDDRLLGAYEVNGDNSDNSQFSPCTNILSITPN